MTTALGWHVNAWRGGARASVLAAPGPLLILNTALDVGLVADWRARTEAILAYRHVYQGGDPGDRDVQGRCDILSREAAPLLPFGVTVLTPWNEERQDTPLLAAYCEDTIRAVEILRARGFWTAVGNFGVCWPKPQDRHLFVEAVKIGDYYSRHTYGAPALTSEWDRLVGHAFADAEWVWQQTQRPGYPGKRTLVTEFGIDWGVLGFTLDGWRSHGGIAARAYADQLVVQAAAAPECIAALFIYCCGQFGDWASFDVAGEPAIEDAVRMFRGEWESSSGGNGVSTDELHRWANDVWKRAGLGGIPETAIAKAWLDSARAGHYLGRPEGPEHPSEHGVPYQEFSSAVLHWDAATGTVSPGLPF